MCLLPRATLHSDSEQLQRSLSQLARIALTTISPCLCTLVQAKAYTDHSHCSHSLLTRVTLSPLTFTACTVHTTVTGDTPWIIQIALTRYVHPALLLTALCYISCSSLPRSGTQLIFYLRTLR
jgi:hypothetical protein